MAIAVYALVYYLLFLDVYYCTGLCPTRSVTTLSAAQSGFYICKKPVIFELVQHHTPTVQSVSCHAR